MTMIKKFSEFIKEEISGTELGIDGSFGPGSPASSVPNTINYNDTTTILGDGEFYTEDNFKKLLDDFKVNFRTEYDEYIKNGGTDEFNDFNINYILKQKKDA
jgi:hypothetical protein